MSIVKLAKDFMTLHYEAEKAYDNMMQPHLDKTTGPYGVSALSGGAIGGLIGTMAKRPIIGALIGAGAGALVGAGYAETVHQHRAHRSARTDKNYNKIINTLDSYDNFLNEKTYNDEIRRENVRSIYRR